MDPTTITPGIYFGLPEDVYHAAPYLGSSNMNTLYASPPDYWWNSAMNPLRPADEPSHAQKFGTALHVRILHGEAEFLKRYQHIAGDDGEMEVSAENLKAWIKEQGGTPAKTKAENFAMVEKEYGVGLLSERVFQRIMMSGQMILKNPHLAHAFTNGFPEVSVFWMQGSVPCKARFDYLKKRAIVDLKSFRMKDRIRGLDQAVLQDLFGYRYDIQTAHYINGHRAMVPLLAEGKVWTAPGALRPSDEWLASAFKDDPHWVFCFYKADEMPIAKSYQIPNGSPAHESGKYAVNTALAAYEDYLARFGTEAWVNMDEPFNIAEEDMPKWL